MDIVIYLIIISLILTVIFWPERREHFWDLAPYNLHWDIFKCLDGDCVRKKSYECNQWCDNWDEPGGSTNCKMRCLDYADQMYDSLKFQDHTWNYLLPRFDKVSILEDRGDYVEWNTKDKHKHKVSMAEWDATRFDYPY